MTYNFDEIVDRKKSYSMKWDLKDDVVPLWVADMDFRVPDEIVSALHKRVEHGIYGYSIMPDAFYDAEILWWKKRHQTNILKDWILPTTGVVAGISSAVQAVCEKDDEVIVISPVYQYFYSSVRNNGAKILYCPLINEDGKYRFDVELLASLAQRDHVKMIFICNPHNPVGRVWSEDELSQVADIAYEHQLVVVSDEIHRDLTYEKAYTPMIKIDKIKDLLITCTAPSKTFNLAGLKTANIIVSNETLRSKVDRALNDKEAIEPGVFGIDALIAAYNYGDTWLDELRAYLQKNRDFSYRYIKENMPKAVVTPLEGTYLLWIDLNAYGVDAKEAEQDLLDRGLFINGGYKYGDANSFIRINLATKTSLVEEGLHIIKDYLDSL